MNFPSVIDSYLSLLDHSSDYFYIKSCDRKFLHANEGLLKLFHCESLHEIVGKTDFDFVPHYLADRYAKEEEKIFKTGKPLLNRIELLSRDHIESLWHITTKLPYYDNNKIVGLLGISRTLKKGDEFPHKNTKMNNVLIYIKNHYGEQISVQSLAQICNMSVSAFERNFKKNFGTSPIAYLKLVRLNIACRYLTETEKSLSDIALSCAFCDQSYFTAEFSRHMKLSPLKYRQKYA